jgi:hypothetical protein
MSKNSSMYYWIEPPFVHFLLQIAKNPPCTYWIESPFTFLPTDWQKVLHVSNSNEQASSYISARSPEILHGHVRCNLF